jgi:cytochrome c-type biogenesis protein CcmF
VNSRGTPTGQPARSPGVIHTPLQDVYVVLREVGDNEHVTARISFNPLISSIWAGGALLVLGGILALVAAMRRRPG